MLDSETKNNILQNSIQREIIIRFPEEKDSTEVKEISSDNIIADSFELSQSICDDTEFKLGGCIAGQLTVQVIGIEQQLNNKRINVFLRQTYSNGELYPSENLYPSDSLFPGEEKKSVEIQIFSGTIDSSLRQKNRAVKEIIAYDDLYNASRLYVYNYFSSLAAYSPNVDLETIRWTLINSFIDYDYKDEFVGFNDSKKLSLSLELVKSVCNSKLTVADLLSAYCELNSCFSVMNGQGKIKFIELFNSQTEDIEYYKDLTFQEYTTRPINIIKFQYAKDQTFAFGHGADKQSWYVSDNIITRCCTDVSEIIMAFNSNGQNYIFYDLYKYRPFNADVFARWWIEAGDKIRIKTGYTDTEVVESFVLSRNIKGINGMTIKLIANGTEYLGKEEINNNELQ